MKIINSRGDIEIFFTTASWQIADVSGFLDGSETASPCALSRYNWFVCAMTRTLVFGNWASAALRVRLRMLYI